MAQTETQGWTTVKVRVAPGEEMSLSQRSTEAEITQDPRTSQSLQQVPECRVKARVPQFRGLPAVDTFREEH